MDMWRSMEIVEESRLQYSECTSPSRRLCLLANCRVVDMHSLKLNHTHCTVRRFSVTSKDFKKAAARIQTVSSATYDVVTIPGEKKDIQIPLPKTYSAKFTEACWNDWWEKRGFFKPTNVGEKFIMCLPPPNVTGKLHIGHAFTGAIQDALVRWARMKGLSTLWIPGLDHAGIATQVVVEKQLWRDEQVTRHDLGRQQFVQQVWKWKHQRGDDINKQMRRMGLSLDWSHSVFTMDQKLSDAVNHAFVRLFDDGLIHRQNRMVNWCCHLKSAIADIEVDNVPVEEPMEFTVPGYNHSVALGYLTSFAYPIAGSDEEIIVATTRLETMLGDTAIAVHPSDNRYTHLIGSNAQHPFCDRLLPIIADEAVIPDLGTGAVKLTPSHSLVDHEIAQRHNLRHIDILEDSGHLINCGETFNGLKRFDVREKVAQLLQKMDLWRGQTPHHMTVPVCSRSGDIIEPRLKEQWFLDCSEMAQKAIEAVENGQLKFTPPYYKKVWCNFLTQTKTTPWCISRQLWWGHQIPAYKVQETEGKKAVLGWVVAENLTDVIRKGRQLAGHENFRLIQDEDVLDTWFSSALLPFASLGWPKKNSELSAFYPNSMIESGSDILFFWIARMVMLGEKLTSKLPFSEVVIHSLLLSQGKKMSKSKGNIIDPLSIIDGSSIMDLTKSLLESNLDRHEISAAVKERKREFGDGIPECGADSLRMALCSYPFKADAMHIELTTFINTRSFCNKVWQTYKFFAQYFKEGFTAANLDQIELTALDHWILNKTAHLVKTCEENFQTRDICDIVQAVKHYWHSDLSAIYLECCKPALKSESSVEHLAALSVAVNCLDVGLRCLSPFMPFLSEELYQRLPACDKSESICIAPYPTPAQWEKYLSTEISEQFSEIVSISSSINHFKACFGMNHRSKRVGKVFIYHPDKCNRSIIQHLASLSKLEELLIDQVPLDVDRYCHLESESNWSIYIDVSAQLHDFLEMEKIVTKVQDVIRSQTKLLEELNHSVSYNELSDHDKKKHHTKVDSLKQELAIAEKCVEYLLKLG